MTININKINKRIGIISSLLVPLFFFLSELFHPITMDTPAKEIISAQQNSAKWLIAHIFALFALILMPFLVVRLLDFINDNKKKIVIVPYIMAIIGTILTTGLLTFDFFVYVMGKIGTKEDIIQMYDLLNNSI